MLAIAADGLLVHIGGSFHGLETQPQSYLAAFTEVSTAIALATLDAAFESGRVHIRWLVSGSGMAPIGVYRKTPASEWTLLSVPVVGPDRIVSMVDEDVFPGQTYAYRLVVRDANGEESAIENTISIPPGAGAPNVIRLNPITPNPIGNSAGIRYGVPNTGNVRFTIFDARGRLVTVLVRRVQEVGWHEVSWDGRDARGRLVSSGVYFAQLEMQGSRVARKLVVAR
ncbi:MAG TPA: FlgD immunoglobulin-like domain containing protein [Candidatus Eisenbacteria bacterium]|nr:FlgD immunoglobulin-like domain containing protein [Candidatus Eisenbacteria bacterium]